MYRTRKFLFGLVIVLVGLLSVGEAFAQDAPLYGAAGSMSLSVHDGVSVSGMDFSVERPFVQCSERLWRTAFRMNMFAPLLNVGFEAGLGRNRRFVLGADFWYPWLRPFIRDNATCIEGLGGSIEGSFFFRKLEDPCSWVTGPYLGLSLAGGYYDVCFNAKGRQGEGLAATLFFGWSWPVNRNRWRLSLDIGAGYMVTKYREYYIWEDGLAYRPGDWEGVLRWWGPTRASLALHIPIWYRVKD